MRTRSFLPTDKLASGTRSRRSGSRGAAASATRIIADRGYDADALRRVVIERGSEPVISGRRIATRHDKLAANFQSAVTPAAVPAL
ncbi:hypothetical protein SH611_04295 [Geminicoccaceae bacterium 1502E]|nr:hypothetical protein [Geminicoccaceae bacterium 1502E]